MSLQGWIKEELSKCLCFEIPDAMISYICNIREGCEIDEYFRTLLDFKNPEHVKFLGELKRRMGTRPGANNQQASKQTAPAPSGKQKKQSDPPQQRQPQQQSKGKAGPPVATSNSSSTTAAPQPDTAKPVAGGSKKKPKFVSLYGENGELKNVVKLKGRHHCDCQAVKHKLINNCLHCGRIVCEQEGSGPCLFCGSLVCTAEEQQLIDAASRKGNMLKRTLMEQERPNGWAEALATRNRLLEYDRNSARRTAVIDDESDYFRTNSVWLSDAERSKLEKLEEELREQKHASRLSRKVTIDFAGRQVIEEPALTGEVEAAIIRSVDETLSGKKTKSKSKGGNGQEAEQQAFSNQPILAEGTSTHPRLIGPAPLFLESGSCTAPQGFRPSNGFDGVYSRLQDKQFLEMSDLRHCLSMHQPWASLLVAGIKRHEGRTWYSSHRGRLWIASTAKPVSPEMVQELEDFYRRQYPDENLEFPTQYPAGCLLGCVNVEDCLPQEEYRKQYPNGESDSPYVFICTDAQELPIRFPVKGDHKIYMLESKVHQAAVKSLQRLAPVG
ncbi:activating signal cointegrator 1 [Anopheles darlingi]|uniref:Activating signal cointegrator 1 n=1 Tax=Anopheles darlingi TaxID=43151 RepID=W5JSK4_ANODA|nr:activating signal cointegrator 1 [Anopheles darlingi]